MQSLQQYEQLGHERFQAGDYIAAQHAFEQAINVANQIGLVSTYTAQLWNNLGLLAHLRNNLQIAQHAYEHALVLHRTAPNPDYPQMAITLHNLGRVFQASNEHHVAWNYFTEELALWKDHHTPDHLTHIATCLYALGELMVVAGEYDRARRNMEQALQLRLEILGANDITTIDTFAELGMLCQIQGDNITAQYYLRHAQDGYRQALGANHPVTQGITTRLTNLF